MLRDLHRLAIPPRVERRLVQRDQRLEQEGVVFEEPADLRRSQKAAVGVTALSEQECPAGDRGIDVGTAAEGRAGVGQRGDHQRVPGGELLVVEPWSYARGTRSEQLALDLR